MITLKRVSSTKQGTFGVLLGDNKLPICVTLENPWLDNNVNVSCIPFGRYICYKHLSNKFKITTFRVANVDNRSGIIFHAGNTVKDTLGCILLGTSFTEFPIKDSPDMQPAVSESVLAHTRMMESLDGLESFIMEIRE